MVLPGKEERVLDLGQYLETFSKNHKKSPFIFRKDKTGIDFRKKFHGETGRQIKCRPSTGIGIEQRPAMAFVRADHVLPALRNQPPGKPVGQIMAYMGIFFRIHRNRAVRVFQLIVAFIDHFRIVRLAPAILVMYLVPERKPSFSPISASGSNFNPHNHFRRP